MGLGYQDQLRVHVAITRKDYCACEATRLYLSDGLPERLTTACRVRVSES